MNINSVGNFSINYITNNIKNPGDGAKSSAPQNPLESMENRFWSHFDIVEISGAKPVDAEELGIKVLEEQQVKKPGPNARLSTHFTNEQVSEKAETLSWLMDENSLDIEARVGFGMSQEQLAQHFGEIGRQIDEAFDAGEITRQEYDDLNAGIAQYSEAVTGRAERQAAMWEVIKDMAKATRAMVESGASREEMSAYAQRNMETMRNRIDEFVEKYCAIDRNLMAKLISQVRGGEDLIQPGVQQTYGKNNMAGYFKNGYVPFQPDEYV